MHPRHSPTGPVTGQPFGGNTHLLSVVVFATRGGTNGIDSAPGSLILEGPPHLGIFFVFNRHCVYDPKGRGNGSPGIAEPIAALPVGAVGLQGRL